MMQRSAHFRRLGILGLSALMAMAPTGLAHAKQRATSWSINACNATGTLDDGTKVNVTLENCIPKNFHLKAGESIAWRQPYSNDWFEPDVPGEQVVPLLYVTNTKGRVVFEFSRPVADPVLHVAHLGGGTMGQSHDYKMRYSQRWKLATPGVALNRVAGNPQFAVTSDTIQMANVSILDGDCSKTYGCGSAQLKGTVSRVAFDIDMDIEGGRPQSSPDAVHFTLSGQAATKPQQPAYTPPAYPTPTAKPPTGPASDYNGHTQYTPAPDETPEGSYETPPCADETPGPYRSHTRACNRSLADGR